MILNSNNVKSTMKAFDKGKQISRVNVTHNQIADYFTTINKINSLGYGETIVKGGYLTSKYYVPEEFEKFILPAEIQAEVGNNSMNLKSDVYYNEANIAITLTHTVKAEKDGEEDKEISYTGKVLSAQDFTDISVAIQGLKKHQNDAKLKSVDTMLIRGLLTDSIKASSNGDCCHETDVAFFPRILKHEFYKSTFYNKTNDEMFDEWVRQQLMKL